MKYLLKLSKRFLLLILIIIFPVSNFAAVSVSDGSAFVSKSEFSSTINNISNRMSIIENTLDAKIDSLVSSYLSRNGIWNGDKQTLTNTTIDFPTPIALGVDAYRSLGGTTASSKLVLFKSTKSGLAFVNSWVYSTLGNSSEAWWGYNCGARIEGTRKNLYDDALSVYVEFANSTTVLATWSLHNGGSTIEGINRTSSTAQDIVPNFLLVYTIPASKLYTTTQFFVEKGTDYYWQFKADARHGFNASESRGQGRGRIGADSVIVY